MPSARLAAASLGCRDAQRAFGRRSSSGASATVALQPYARYAPAAAGFEARLRLMTCDPGPRRKSYYLARLGATPAQPRAQKPASTTRSTKIQTNARSLRAFPHARNWRLSPPPKVIVGSLPRSQRGASRRGCPHSGCRPLPRRPNASSRICHLGVSTPPYRTHRNPPRLSPRHEWLGFS